MGVRLAREGRAVRLPVCNERATGAQRSIPLPIKDLRSLPRARRLSADTPGQRGGRRAAG